MKKIKFLVMTAAVFIGFQYNVKAALPSEPMLIVGNKAYYYSDISSKIDEINNQIFNNPTEIFYNNGTTILNVVTNSTISELQLTSLVGSNIYYYKNGSTTNYVFGTNGYNPVSSSNYVTVQISLTKVLDNSLYIVNAKITNISGITGAAYYKIYNSGLKNVNETISTSVQSASGTVPIYIYSSNDTTNYIAMGSVTLPSTTDGTVSTINVPLTSYATTTPTSSTSSLGQGNMSNTGLVAADDTYRYYSNTADNGKIYKLSDSGLENYVICDDNAKYITVVGGWVYYSNYSDGGKIYKVKTDGTRKQKISDNIGTFLNVVGDKIYYSNKSDGGKLYCLDSSGNSNPVCSDEADYVSVSGGNTIFYSNASDGGKLYSISLNGINRQLKSSIPNVKYINTSDSANVYYSTADGKVYKVGDTYPIALKLVTTDKSGNSSVPKDEEASNINVSDSNIYYISLLDGNKIYKAGTNGGVGEKITDVAASDINIYVQNPDSANLRKDIIYFTQGGKLFQVLDPIATVDKNGNTTYKLQTAAVTKPKATVTIKTVSNIAVSVDDTDVGKGIGDIDLDKYIPDKVPATMSDNTIKQLVVNWDRSNYTNKNGVCTFTGTIVGYNKTITLSLTLASNGIGSQYIQVTNNIGKNDTLVTLDGANLSAGDTLKVYDSLTATKPIAQQKADASGKISIAGMDLNKNGGILYVSVTRGTQAESRRTAVSYGVELPAAPTGVSIDLSKVATSGPADSTNDIDITNLQVNSSTESVIVGNLQYRVAAINAAGKVATVGESDWKEVPSTGVISNTIGIGKGGAQIQFRTKASGTTPASAATNAIVISPRGAAPSGLYFDEQASTNYPGYNKEIVTGTTANMEYSLNGTKWDPCTLGTTVVDQVGSNIPVQVRKRATMSALPSIPAIQIKITSISSGSPYSISELNGTITLQATAPATWSVTDENDTNGTATTKATIVSTSSDGTQITLKGSENGRVKVWATAKDGTGLKGYAIVTIGAQKTVTVSNDADLAAALADKSVEDIKLLSRVYAMSSYDDTKSVVINGQTISIGRDLTIEGTGNMSQIKVQNLNSNSSFMNANNNKLTLKNLTIDGNAQNISSVVNASKDLMLDGVYFVNIKNDNGVSIGINQTSGALTVKGSTFDSTNLLNNVISISNTTSSATITNNNFTASSGTLSGYQNAVCQTVGASAIKGNTFRNYSHYDASQSNATIGKMDSAIVVTGSSAIIGGTGLLEPNSFDNCVTPVVISGATTISPSNLLNGNNNVSNPVLYNGNLLPIPVTSGVSAGMIATITSTTNPISGGTTVTGTVTGGITSGSAYLISSAIPYSSCNTKTLLDNLAQNPMTASKAVVSSGTVTINAPYTSGTYNLIVVDSNGNVSPKSANVITVDATAPALVSDNTAAYVSDQNSKQIILTFDEDISASAPSYSDFVISGVTGLGFSSVPAEGVKVTGKTVTLTLNQSVTYGQNITVTYTGTSIQDSIGNKTAPFTHAVSNTAIAGVAPTLNVDVTNNTNTHPIVITFNNTQRGSAWITNTGNAVVKVNGVTLTSDKYSWDSNNSPTALTINANVLSTGSNNIIISVPGYLDASVTQTINQGVTLGSVSEIAKGVTPVKQVATIQVTGTVATAGTLTVDGTSVNVGNGDLASAAANKIATAINGDSNSKWTATEDGSGKITFTAITTAANSNILINQGIVTGLIFGAQGNPVNGAAEVKEKDQVQVTSAATINEIIYVNFSDGTITKQILVTLSAGDTVSVVAQKIAAALNADTTINPTVNQNYTIVQGTGTDVDKVIVTQSGTGVDVNLQVSLDQTK